ncbi:unnamed protein product [Adineta steineri]|uniref:Transmembrane protein 120-like protein n=1 Tax=Adineta steineri TaxID=433720 RepID=A0A815NFJ6_9BILA|nr:unnamed protein product [Adineta steineri]CAF3670425.1 unnamed protein product [Adineta steineri]
MTSDTVFISDDEKNHRPTTRHFDVVHSDEDDEENQTRLLSSDSTDNPLLSSSSPPTTTTNVDTFDDKELNQLYDDWLEFDTQLRVIEPKHKEYVRRLDDVESLKTKYRLEFDKYKKKLDHLKKDVNQLKKVYAKKEEATKKNNSNVLNVKTSKSTTNLEPKNSSQDSTHPLPTVNSSPSLDKIVNNLTTLQRLNVISEQINTNELYLSRVSDTLPRKDPYLKVILGGVDVSILNKADRWTYKQEYEKFKFIVTCISLVSSLVIWSLTSRYRAFDALFHFLLVWYYCTLTIRESILIVNGSNINPWWRAHHFIATVATAILLTWPESQSYHAFRTQFFVFSFFLSFVQVLQFYYQRGCLYRLRALGETHDMDITIEGFHRWMFHGLSFLVPFLLVGYLFQLYNAYTLWQLAHVSTTHEWQVMVLAIIFFLLFLGNILTTLSVLRDKLREKTPPSTLRQKYQSLKTFLSTNYHRRSRSFHQFGYRQEKEQTDNIDVTSKDD